MWLPFYSKWRRINHFDDPSFRIIISNHLTFKPLSLIHQNDKHFWPFFISSKKLPSLHLFIWTNLWTASIFPNLLTLTWSALFFPYFTFTFSTKNKDVHQIYLPDLGFITRSIVNEPAPKKYNRSVLNLIYYWLLNYMAYNHSRNMRIRSVARYTLFRLPK